MMEYVAPQKDMQFALKYLANMASISELPGFEEISIELTDAVMEEAAKYAAEVLSPLNAVGDREGACLLYTSPSPRDKRQSRMPSSA